MRSLLAAAILALSLARAVHARDEVSPDLIRRVQLEWQPVREAVVYELELATDPDFSHALYAEKIDATQFNADLLPGAYYYHVRAIDRNGHPGRWTAVQDLNVNARPPVLLWPQNGEVIRGNLPDTGLPLEWRTSGPGIRYLIEIRAADAAGEFTRVLAKQEVNDTVFPFYPQEISRFQWSVHTLGAGGDEPGETWEFEVAGTMPPGGDKLIVRYVAPWWRNHWTLYSRYGQAQAKYKILDQEIGATSEFTGLTGYVNETLYWEWHDPVGWTRGGIPWFALEFELDRQTVLAESAVLQRRIARFGAWYDQWVQRWRFSPVVEVGSKEVSIYQPRTPTEAARSNATRLRAALGAEAVYKVRPFFHLGASAKYHLEFGGLAGLATINGDQLDLTRRSGTLNSPGRGLELTGRGTLLLGTHMKVEGRLRYESELATWTPRFQAVRRPGDPPEGDTELTLSNMSFDVAFGLNF